MVLLSGRTYTIYLETNIQAHEEIPNVSELDGSLSLKVIILYYQNCNHIKEGSKQFCFFQRYHNSPIGRNIITPEVPYLSLVTSDFLPCQSVMM